MRRHIDPATSHGGLFYDDETIFSRYAAHRSWAANPNVVMEEPALLGMVGDVTGARVIDLGCGDAALVLPSSKRVDETASEVPGRTGRSSPDPRLGASIELASRKLSDRLDLPVISEAPPSKGIPPE